MFSLNDSQDYYLCSHPIDMRKGFDSLCGVVRSFMKRDPLSGEVFVFINKPRTRIKLLHIRKKYALKKGEGVIIGELPSLTLPKSNAGASLLAHLLMSKYQDHLPFYRQLEIFKRSCVHLAASTVNDWCTSAIKLLEPLYQTLRKQVLNCDYIQVDESTIPILDKDKPGSAKKGYFWVVRSPEQQQLFFHYDKGSRARYVVVELLKDFKGAIQSDGYGAYQIYEKKELDRVQDQLILKPDELLPHKWEAVLSK